MSTHPWDDGKVVGLPNLSEADRATVDEIVTKLLANSYYLLFPAGSIHPEMHILVDIECRRRGFKVWRNRQEDMLIIYTTSIYSNKTAFIPGHK